MPPKVPRFYHRSERSSLERLLREGGAERPAQVVDAIETSALIAMQSCDFAKLHPSGGRGDATRLLRIQSAARLLKQAMGSSFSAIDDIEDFDQWLREAANRRTRAIDWTYEFPAKPFGELLDDLISAANATLDGWNSKGGGDALDDEGRNRVRTIPKLTIEGILRGFIDDALVAHLKATKTLPTANDTSRPVGAFSLFMEQAIAPVAKALGRPKKWNAMRSQINRRRKALLVAPRS